MEQMVPAPDLNLLIKDDFWPDQAVLFNELKATVQSHWVHAIKRQSEAIARISLTWRAFNAVE